MLLQRRDGFGQVNGRLALSSTLSVRPEGLLQRIADTQIIDNQPAGFLAKDTVDASDRLHQPVSLHRLVDVHGMGARGVESCEPHIPDDDQLERRGRFFESGGQFPAAFLRTNVFLPVRTVSG